MKNVQFTINPPYTRFIFVLTYIFNIKPLILHITMNIFILFIQQIRIHHSSFPTTWFTCRLEKNIFNIRQFKDRYGTESARSRRAHTHFHQLLPAAGWYSLQAQLFLYIFYYHRSSTIIGQADQRRQTCLSTIQHNNNNTKHWKTNVCSQRNIWFYQNARVCARTR